MTDHELNKRNMRNVSSFVSIQDYLRLRISRRGKIPKKVVNVGRNVCLEVVSEEVLDVEVSSMLPDVTENESPRVAE
jgi:hypothetical protein